MQLSICVQGVVLVSAHDAEVTATHRHPFVILTLLKRTVKLLVPLFHVVLEEIRGLRLSLQSLLREGNRLA